MLYSLRDIRVHRGQRCILDIDKLDITKGRVYSLVGPNGAGKSTLLNVLAFLLKPDSGTIVCNDVPVQMTTARHRLRQQVVLVDQYPILFTGPVWKNIDFGLKIRKIPKEERQKRIKEVLERVGMLEFANADAHRLSGGETKRIALARALAVKPGILLCDEPTANVDAENQERILEILEYCNKTLETSLFFATHYLSQAQRLADFSIVLQNGTVSTGGNENIFTVCYAADKWMLACELLLPPEVNTRHPAQTVCRVQIDPRLITLSRSENTGSACLWKGQIVRIERENMAIRLTVDCGVRVDILLDKAIYTKESYLVGEWVFLEIRSAGCHFL
ncbi:MAG: hypothetical protein DSY80_01225 [Desulfocapsa sp.]|nr:MAG: hypothetical protein DSY80_01225 [Desulfocapsa sp.]